MGLHLEGCYEHRQGGQRAAGFHCEAGKSEPTSVAGRVPSAENCTNDLKRLGRIAGMINRAMKSSHVVALGGAGSAPHGGLVSIDYALFDKLSDDGVAVLVAKEILTSSKLLLRPQGQGRIERGVLATDEAVGRCVARAGFRQTGFGEWLNIRKVSAAELQDSLPESIRIAAFMRGYFAENGGKRK